MGSQIVTVVSVDAGKGIVEYSSTGTATLGELAVMTGGNPYQPKLQKLFDEAYQANNGDRLDAISSICSEIGITLDGSGKIAE